ncbi:MAG: B12-binding domain-containing radical SAM protein [Candidatus Fermentibacterota bacterium]
MKVVLMTMPAVWEQDQHDFMNRRRRLFRWLRIPPQVNVVPSPSLLYLAPFLEEDGHEVVYLEGLFYSLEKVLEKLDDLQPDLIGMTLLSVDWENGRGMIDEIKDRFPQSVVVAGGIHPTLWRRRCLEEARGIDYIVYGEGELTLRELVRTLEEGGDPAEVLGLAFRRGGDIVVTPPRAQVEDIDTLPFPAHGLVDMDRYLPSPTFYKSLPHANIIGARGCPYQCIFCHTDPHLRMRSAENIADEIEELYREHGVRDIAFWDDTFTLSEKRAFAFCEEMIHRGIHVDWAVNARVDRISRPLLEKMKEAGCWRVLYGVESGVQKNLDTLRKGTTLEQIREAVSMTSEAGIEAYGTFMFGIPGETFEEGLQTIEFALSLDLDYAVFVNLTPLPGTEVYRRLMEGEIQPAKFTKDRFNFKNVSFVPEGMTEEQIRYLIQTGHRRFYLRPGLIWKKIRSIRTPLDLWKYVKGFLLLATAEYEKPCDGTEPASAAEGGE